MSISFAAVSGQEGEKPKLSGKFDREGRRLEMLLVARGPQVTPEAVERQCKSVAEWGDRAKTARSASHRAAAAGALNYYAFREGRFPQPDMPPAELAEMRTVCLELSSAKEAEVRRPSVSALSAVADKSCIARFNQLLSDSDGNVQRTAMQTLERIGDDTSVLAIKEFLAKPRHVTETNIALNALVGIGSPAARALLEDFYKNSANPTLKEAAAEALDDLDFAK